MKKILITGDSWGSGEWSFVNGTLANTHPGLGIFLQYGIIENGYINKKLLNYVYNISIPAGNSESILKSLNETDNLSSFDYIIIFVTDYLRNIRVDDGCVDFKYVNSKSKLIKIYNEIEDEFLESLSKIPNKNIILLGGLSKINTNKLLQYDNIISPIPSIIEFIRPEVQQHDILVENFLRKIPDTIEYDYLDFIKRQWDMWETVKKDMYFLFDGQHPDRNAHLLIYKKIKSILNL